MICMYECIRCIYISLYVNVSVLGALTCFSRRAARRVCRISPAGAALSPPEHSPRGSCCFHSPDESLADPTDPWHPAATQLIIHTYMNTFIHTCDPHLQLLLQLSHPTLQLTLARVVLVVALAQHGVPLLQLLLQLAQSARIHTYINKGYIIIRCLRISDLCACTHLYPYR